MPGEFDRLIAAARTHCKKNGEQLADYLRFLAFSGAREQEALRIKWDDVDFARKRVTIGADQLSKNWESRTVEFNPQLGTLLRRCAGAVLQKALGCFLRRSAVRVMNTQEAFARA